MRYLLYTKTYSKNLRSRKILFGGGMVRGQNVKRAWWQITDSDCTKKIKIYWFFKSVLTSSVCMNGRRTVQLLLVLAASRKPSYDVVSTVGACVRSIPCFMHLFSVLAAARGGPNVTRLVCGVRPGVTADVTDHDILYISTSLVLGGTAECSVNR